MNVLTLLTAGRLAGSELLFWLVVILVILGILWLVRRF